ncbi:hypothetical protein HYC85_000300 [Camellia sinensis]|uniref:RNase H type-1 domain-containing protein n=1 Tax=Camellia sinensis TaxID=4442 RepID=A0A7J7I3G1_CAMSI|nr:hypothetical protein HYC85_000300 [Camellia sinensis]
MRQLTGAEAWGLLQYFLRTRRAIIDAKIRLATSIQGEASVVQLACTMSRALNCANVEIESDCKNVIQLCVSERVPPWDICAVMNDIWSMAAHWVASTCLHDTLPVNWVSQPPMAFVGCL